MDLAMIGSLLRSAAASLLLESPSTKIVAERVASTEKEASYNRKGDQSANHHGFFLGGGFLNFRMYHGGSIFEIIFENLPSKFKWQIFLHLSYNHPNKVAKRIFSGGDLWRTHIY